MGSFLYTQGPASLRVLNQTKINLSSLEGKYIPYTKHRIKDDERKNKLYTSLGNDYYGSVKKLTLHI